MKKMFIGLFLEDANAKICLIAIYFEDIGIISYDERKYAWFERVMSY